jgi:glycosyltransferase involved in cell wall biosynthesis
MNETVTILIPCRNEEAYILTCLESINANTYPKEKLEVLVFDGRSNDQTRSLIEAYVRHHPYIQLIDNPKQTVPHALNQGIEKARGELIIIMGVHSVYPKDYIKQCVNAINIYDADNVGGIANTLPANDSSVAQAVATVLSHPLGVGNSLFRIGTDKVCEVDTVPCGCYRKRVFDRIGGFDTDLIRGQDAEFNARLKQAGGKIYLIPEIQSSYYARASFKQMARMLYQYGYFKPLMNLKLKRPATLRQFAPPLLIVFLIATPWFGFMHLWFVFGYLILLGLYLLVLSLATFLSNSSQKIKQFPFVFFCFIIAHLSYGIGYWKGILDFAIIRKHKKRNIREMKLSR